MSSSSSGYGSGVWPYAAAGILAGLGAGYTLGIARSRWLVSAEESAAPRRESRPGPSPADAVHVSDGAPSGNLVAAVVELTAEIARLRQTIESGGLLSRLPLSRPSMRGASTADFVSAQGDNTESDDEFFDPNDQELEEEEGGGGGVTMAAPDFAQLDELGHSSQGSQDSCVSLIEQIRTAINEFPENVGLLWRLARALFYLSTHLEQHGDTEGQKQLIEEASEHAQKALEITDDVWQVHQWYAITVGSLTKYEGTQKKIEMGFKYKEHIDKAISLNPEEKTLHHLRGRFCFEVAGVSWLEKKAAAALFGSPPESTYQEALDSLMKAEEKGPGEWKTNALFIAKCHLRQSDIPTAVEWLQKAYYIPTNTAEDYTAHAEVEELLSKNDPNFTSDTT